MINMAASTTAPTKASNAATPVTKARVATFIKAYRTGEQSVVTKARVIGESIASGSTVGKVTETLRDALVAQSLIVPKSFSASVTHYNTAYTCANTLNMSTNDSVLHALYQISTGVVKAAEREAFVTFHASKGSTPEEVVSSIRSLLSKARADKKAPASAAPVPSESDVAEDAVESLSPMADLKSLLKQAGAILDVLADNDEDAYLIARDALTEFAAKYLATIEEV